MSQDATTPNVYVDDPDADDDTTDGLVTGPTDGQLQRVTELAKLQLQCEREVIAAEKQLKTAQEALKQVAERDLPRLMDEAGILEYRLTDGVKVSIKTKVVGAILAENRPAAFAWLHKHGFGPIVKRDVEVQFGRGDAKKAGSLLGYLRRWYKDFKVSDKEGVHGGTLNAWARELTERNAAALRDGGKLLELPDEITITELRASTISLPEGMTTR